jgi:hypothetical protein
MEINPLDETKRSVSDIELTEEQKLMVLKFWEQSNIPPPIADIVKKVWPDATKEMLDGRYAWAKAIKSLLVQNDLPLNLLQPPPKFVTLTDEQKEYIVNHCQTMKPVEMTRELFQNQMLSPMSAEAREVLAHIKQIDPAMVPDSDSPGDIYKPPRQVPHVLVRIKKYVNITRSWDKDKLTPTQKKSCEALIHYLHDMRFCRQINSYEKVEDKITFESEFIKYCYNKPELEQEEISQYVALCSFVVQEFNIKNHIEMLQRNIEREYEEKDGKISGNLIEALESARSDLGSCTLRQGKLYESLTEKRSEKMSKELKDKESLLNLFNTWKNYDSRQQLIKIRQKDKESLRKQIEEIEDMSELKQRVLGLTIDDIIDG